MNRLLTFLQSILSPPVLLMHLLPFLWHLLLLLHVLLMPLLGSLQDLSSPA
jgi:hypothetical protein